VDFDRVLKEVLWRLVTEGSISYRRMKLSFRFGDDCLEELRRELIVIKRVAAGSVSANTRADGLCHRITGSRRSLSEPDPEVPTA
jgi:hypothetical protein